MVQEVEIDLYCKGKIRALTLSIVLIVTPNRTRKSAVFRRHVRVFFREERGAQVKRRILAIISVYDRVVS